MKSYLHLLHQNLIIIVKNFYAEQWFSCDCQSYHPFLHFNCPVLPVTSVVILLLSF